MEQRLLMEGISMKRYELPPPPPGKQTDAAAWLESVENSYAQLEHQAARLISNINKNLC
jgi:pre-mRNA-splicing factor SPF27